MICIYSLTPSFPMLANKDQRKQQAWKSCYRSKSNERSSQHLVMILAEDKQQQGSQNTILLSANIRSL